MSLTFTALKIIAPSVAKWLLESMDIQSKLTNAVLEQAVDVVSDELLNNPEAQQTLEQQAEKIAKKLRAEMQPLFEHEAQNLERGSHDAILLGVAETLIKARLTSKTLAEINFDGAKLKQYLLSTNPEAVRFFSQNEKALYQQAIAIVSQSLIEAAPQVEGFALSTAATTLQRLEEIASQLKAQREQAVQAEDKFASQYRRIVQAELDRLEVFGLPRMNNITSRQSLSSAYIALSVSGKGEEDEKSPLTLMGDERSEREAGRRSRCIDDVICDCRRLVIRGGAGAGKSTLMQWLAVRAASQTFSEELQHWNYKIPFFIRLRSLSDSKFPTPETFPAMIAPNIAAMMPPGWVHRYLSRGQALVLIDGVDELPRKERQDFFEALKDLVRDFSEATYVVTSRPSGLKNIQGEEWQEWEDWVEAQSFVNLTLEPMNTTNVKEFVKRWHLALPPDRTSATQPEDPVQIAENLNRQLIQRAELRRLASTPLLCAMICALHRERRETLPSARLKLYEECIDMLLTRRDEGRKIPLDETYPIGLNEVQKIELLQSFALKLMRLNRSVLDSERVDGHFEIELRKTSLPSAITGKHIRDLFVDRAGLLREPAVRQIDFAHRTFQEYLAAKAALDDDSLEELLKQAKDDQWRESIIVAAGLARPKERVKLLEALIEQGNSEPGSKNNLHLLAVACLETATTVEQTTRDRVLACAKTLLPPKDEDEAMMVARAGNEIVPLLKYASHYSAEESCQCIAALVQIGTKAAMQNLVDYAKATFEEDDQHSIGRAIGRGWDIFDQNTYCSYVLSHLRILDIGEMQVSQVSDLRLLGTLTQLKRLDLDNTQVTDVSPLSELTQLNTLYLSYTQVTDVSPLSELTQLNTLYLNNTQVTDVSLLSKLTQLNALDLSYTQVTDVSPLSGLTQLRQLHLNNTQVTDVSPLSELTQLNTLFLNNTQVTDVLLLSKLTQLNALDLSDTQVTDVSPLSGLTQLRQLHLNNTQVTDVSPLSELTQLNTLFLNNTQVTDVSPLSKLTQLNTLILNNTQVTDVSPLSKLTQLRQLYLNNIQVADVLLLSKLTQLNTLVLSNTQVTDVLLLSKLTQLNTLFLNNTQVTDVSPLSKLTQLNMLSLSGTQVMDVLPLKHLPNLRIFTDDKEKMERWEAMGMKIGYTDHTPFQSYTLSQTHYTLSQTQSQIGRRFFMAE